MKPSFPQYLKDRLWQPMKALICAVLLYPIYGITLNKQAAFLDGFTGLSAVFVEIFAPLTILICFFSLLKFFDTIDDAAFVSLCTEEGTPTHFLRRAPWLLSLAISGVVGGVPLGLTVYRVMSYTSLSAGICALISMVGAILVSLGLRALMIHLLYKKWLEQRIYYRGTYQYPPFRKRVIQAIIFCVGVILASAIGLANIVWAGYTVLFGAIMLIGEFLWPIVVVIVLLFLIHIIRLLVSRGKFLKRLKRMQEKGEIHYDYEGHPYLSALFRRVYFGLIITDYTDGTGAEQKPKVYRAVVIGTGKRRLVVACDQNTYQFKHEIRLRMNMRSAAIAASSEARETGVSLATWYSTYGFALPGEDSAEGEPVVIFDPVPYAIYVRRNNDKDDLLPVDNGSKVYGYTVWAKNSFANFLERT